MLRRWMMVIVLCSVLTTPAGAKELTGFGPIKFGMTKEEALEAIGGKGEWVMEDVLAYEIPLDIRLRGAFLTKRSLPVRQIFRDGRAVDVSIRSEWGISTRSRCLLAALKFAGAIRNRYGITPISVFDLHDGKMVFDIVNMEVDMFLFDFDDEASITVTSTTDLYKDECSLSIWYQAPVPDPLPF